MAKRMGGMPVPSMDTFPMTHTVRETGRLMDHLEWVYQPLPAKTVYQSRFSIHNKTAKLALSPDVAKIVVAVF